MVSVRAISVFYQPSRLTRPGHLSVHGCKYWR